MMPIGMSRFGLFVSSAAVAMQSKPMYEKKITAVPAETPCQPKGNTGTQLAGSTLGAARKRKIKIAATLMKTRILLTRADSFVPRIKSKVMIPTMSIAGKLISPPSIGPAVSACGKWKPVDFNKPDRYALHPTATVAEPTEYSKIKPQPTSHATISPSVLYVYVYPEPATGKAAASSE